MRNAYIFQAKPELYPLESKLVEGGRETWLVSNYRKALQLGDIVFFWGAGDRSKRGLYGWGRVTGNAPQHYKGWGWGIEVEYEVKFGRLVSVDEIEKRGVLGENRILTMPIGTNFKLTASQAKGLEALLKRRGERTPQ